METAREKVLFSKVKRSDEHGKHMPRKCDEERKGGRTVIVYFGINYCMPTAACNSAGWLRKSLLSTISMCEGGKWARHMFV